MSPASRTTISIVGAGPYGLSIAAYLRHLGADFRIFGTPMKRWLTQMPKDMLLKSEGCASGLPDPEGRYGLTQFCRERGLSYAEYGTPLSRETFSAYALSFQKKFVPHLEDVLVTGVRRTGQGFEVSLSTGETFTSSQVVLATGLDHMEYIPEQLRGLPSELMSHSMAHYDVSRFKNKEVIVIGAGQSALEIAALLQEEGVSVTVVVRASGIVWNNTPSIHHRSIYQRLRRPRTQLGEGLKLWFYDNAPDLFRYLPLEKRLAIVKVALGPAGGWWLKERVLGKVPILTGNSLRAAEERNGKVVLLLTDQNGQPKQLSADHVIASTGYRFNFQHLPFLDENLKSHIASEGQMPWLSRNFESSVPGLYFTGLSSANSFGPVMRFIAGTGFTAHRIAQHISIRQGFQVPSFAQLLRCVEA
jgi:FAD-dependent urate hydroxylase